MDLYLYIATARPLSPTIGHVVGIAFPLPDEYLIDRDLQVPDVGEVIVVTSLPEELFGPGPDLIGLPSGATSYDYYHAVILGFSQAV